MPIADKTRRKEGFDRWRDANLDRDAENKRAWYEANKAAILERQRERRELARLAVLSRRQVFAGFEIRGRRAFLDPARAKAGLTVKELRRMLEALQ